MTSGIKQSAGAVTVWRNARLATLASSVPGLGMVEKGVVDRSLTMNGTLSNLTQAEFNQHRNQGNLYFTISLSTAIVGAVFGAAAGVLFAMN